MIDEAVELFEHALNGLVKSRYTRIVLDLSRVPEVSSLFVGHLLNCHRSLKSENRSLRICGYQNPVEEILTLLNVHKIIPMDKECPES
jgi:anti-anti-sigma factor